MNREQFLAALNAGWPGCAVVKVATVLHEGCEMDSYVALIRTERSEFLATTDHGHVMQCGPEVLDQALTRHKKASDSIQELLEAALRTDGSRREKAPAPLASSGQVTPAADRFRLHLMDAHDIVHAVTYSDQRAHGEHDHEHTRGFRRAAATPHDRDSTDWSISQITERLDNHENPDPLSPGDLVDLNRQVSRTTAQ